MSDFVVTRPQRQVVYSSQFSQWLKDAAGRGRGEGWLHVLICQKRWGGGGSGILNAWVGKRSLQRQTAAVRVLESDWHDVWGNSGELLMLPRGKSQKLSPSSHSWVDKGVFRALLDYKKLRFLNFKPTDFTSNPFHSPLPQPWLSSDCGQHWML